MSMTCVKKPPLGLPLLPLLLQPCQRLAVQQRLLLEHYSINIHIRCLHMLQIDVACSNGCLRLHQVSAGGGPVLVTLHTNSFLATSANKREGKFHTAKAKKHSRLSDTHEPPTALACTGVKCRTVLACLPALTGPLSRQHSYDSV